MTAPFVTKRHAMKWMIGATVLAGLPLAGCTDAKPSFHGVDITGADYARDFAVKDANGALRTLADFKGKVVVLFFGFAQCPDVCPTTMAELVQVKQQLGADADKLQVLFVTVDPARDTAEVMKAYTGAFDPSFVALIPTNDELERMTKDYKVYFKKVEGKTPTSYSMDHSAASFVYDPQGRLRLYARYGAGVPAMTADVKALLQSS